MPNPFPFGKGFFFAGKRNVETNMEEMKMEMLSFGKLNCFNNTAATARQCAELYCKIWKEPPWCEDFWTPEGVVRTLSEEMKRQDAECYLAENGAVIGFTWGYSVNCQELSEIAGNSQLDFITENAPRVFYVDELGVDPDNRLRGVGRTLTLKLLHHAKGRGFYRIIVRTDSRAIPARTLYGHLGFVELDIRDSRHENRTYWLLNL